MNNHRQNNSVKRFCGSLISSIRLQYYSTVNSEAEERKDKIKNNIFDRIGQSEEQSSTPLHRINHKRNDNNRLLPYIAIAASIAVICTLIGSLMYYKFNTISTATIANIEIVTPKGARSTFTLPDGSHVVLNSNSKLTYPSLFTKGNKIIKLDGEAYFNVEQQRDTPLVISTKNLNTYVLGTELNISAYSEEEQHQLTLITGKVVGEVVHTDKQSEKIELNPNQQLSISSNSQEIARTNVNAKDYALWTQDYIVLRNASLTEIAAKLTRQFNCEILISPNCLNLNDKYVATFDINRHNLDEILNILSYKRDWQYIKDKNKYRIILK